MIQIGAGGAADATSEVDGERPLAGGGHGFVFVGGLHRSGTTLMADLLVAHPNVSGFRGTPVPEDEGQFLQDVYATDHAFGGPGRFAFAPEAHLTEAEADDPADIRRRLFTAWKPHWDLSCPLLVEKTPSNLVMTRFLHAAFPEAAFVMVMRHPVAVAGATRKWSHTNFGSLIHHWVTAYETMLSDIAELDRVTVIRYEDLIAEPAATVAKVFRVVGLPAEDAPAVAAKVRVESGINDLYFERWRRPWPWGPASRRMIERRYGDRVRRLSYDLSGPTPLPLGPSNEPFAPPAPAAQSQTSAHRSRSPVSRRTPRVRRTVSRPRQQVKRGEGDPYVEERYRRFAELLHSDARDVLDFGCGSGRGGRAMAAEVPVRIVGLDRERNRVDELPQGYVASLHSTVATIPAPDETFDAVVAGEVIGNLYPDDVDTTLRECFRVLRHGGQLLLTTTNPSDLKRRLRGGSIFGGPLAKYGSAELAALLAGLGFTQTHVEGCGRTVRYLGRRWPLFVYGSYLLSAEKPEARR